MGRGRRGFWWRGDLLKDSMGSCSSSNLAFTTLTLLSFLATITHANQQQQESFLLSSTTTTPAEKDKLLQFGSNSSFKIALFVDLHYGEDAWIDWGPQQDANSDRVISTVLDQETPDFVVYLGDIVMANNVANANASLYWDKAISPTRARGIPWARVFGNHDDAPFEWPIEWFSAIGVPPLVCPTKSSPCSSGIVARDGVIELYRGFVPTALKNLPNSSIRLTTFDSVKNMIAAGQKESERIEEENREKQSQEVRT